MKNILMILIIIITSFTGLYSQTYEEVVEVDNVGQSDLYDRALRWFVVNTHDSNSSF